MVSIPWVEGRTGGSAGAPPPGVATSRKVRAREPQSRTVPVAQSRTPCHTCDGRWRCVDGCRRARGGRPRLAPKCRSAAERTVSWISECRGHASTR